MPEFVVTQIYTSQLKNIFGTLCTTRHLKWSVLWWSLSRRFNRWCYIRAAKPCDEIYRSTTCIIQKEKTIKIRNTERQTPKMA